MTKIEFPSEIPTTESSASCGISISDSSNRDSDSNFNYPPSYASLLPIQSSSVRVCTIALTGTDKIRLIGTPGSITAPLRSSILYSWGTIQRESNYAGAHEFKLLGAPWNSHGPDSVRSRRLLTAILYTMARAGWNLIHATDVSQKNDDKDTLFFELKTPDPDVEMFTVLFNKSDRIRVLDAPSMMLLVKQAIPAQWKYGVQKEQDYCGAMEVKLQGNPFSTRGDEFVFSRMMLAQMIANFKGAGFQLYSSLYSGVGKDENELECWILRKANSTWC
ncbi:hypothetical protein BG006_004938 [Podila minutissima]|uniref:Uncharacterized protein n=1 Tax=Podila minutissima TaxID=64525 RepID=A0A9P5SQ47_9FUNG|nr:hypothetical protein BG006_004938 [Podila minutissima]